MQWNCKCVCLICGQRPPRTLRSIQTVSPLNILCVFRSYFSFRVTKRCPWESFSHEHQHLWDQQTPRQLVRARPASERALDSEGGRAPTRRCSQPVTQLNTSPGKLWHLEATPGGFRQTETGRHQNRHPKALATPRHPLI